LPLAIARGEKACASRCSGSRSLKNACCSSTTCVRHASVRALLVALRLPNAPARPSRALFPRRADSDSSAASSAAAWGNLLPGLVTQRDPHRPGCAPSASSTTGRSRRRVPARPHAQAAVAINRNRSRPHRGVRRAAAARAAT
jgi:hypothetical protein